MLAGTVKEQKVSFQNLARIFNPSSVAIIGASERAGSIGSAVMHNILGGGYRGRIFPINPNYHKICDIDAYPTIQSVGEAVDLAIIATPIAAVPNIIRECALTGVGGAVVLSAGGKETGEIGREIEAPIVRDIQGTGLRIIGPNCAGIICTRTRLLATFADKRVLAGQYNEDMVLQGNIAFVSQSGAICVGILDLARKEQIDFSHFVTDRRHAGRRFCRPDRLSGQRSQCPQYRPLYRGSPALPKFYDRSASGFTYKADYCTQVRQEHGGRARGLLPYRVDCRIRCRV